MTRSHPRPGTIGWSYYRTTSRCYFGARVGGGMLSGIATACAGTNTKVVAVEPAGSACRCSKGSGHLLRRRVESFSHTKTVADAMPTRLLGEALAWPLAFGSRWTPDGRRRPDPRRARCTAGVETSRRAGGAALAAALSPDFAALRAEKAGESGPRRGGGNVDLASQSGHQVGANLGTGERLRNSRARLLRARRASRPRGVAVRAATLDPLVEETGADVLPS